MDTKEIIEAWINQGYGDDCFWEGWPECPTPEDDLTPKMVAAELDDLRAENERLREHMQEINAIVDECEYDKKTRKTVDRLRHIAKEALK